ncbi:MAG: hypothetical protein K0U66_11225, partial [Gammaproteobacteria bacterium]|nr:hypothetical protein [Gammaproteobacteria bacterium]
MLSVCKPGLVRDGAVRLVGVDGAAAVSPPPPPQATSIKTNAVAVANAAGILRNRMAVTDKARGAKHGEDASKAPANRSLPTHNAPFNRTGTEGAANADTASDARGAQAADTSPEST